MLTTINFVVAYGMTFGGFMLASWMSGNFKMDVADAFIMFVLGTGGFAVLEQLSKERERR